MNAQAIWLRLSRTGLRDDEDVMKFREVILMNKILLVSPLLVLLMLPVEIAINSMKGVPLEIAFIFILLFGLLLQRFRLFWTAKIYGVIFGNAFTVVAGVVAGKGVDNHVSMIPIMLLGLFLFKRTRDRVLVFLITVFSYLVMMKLQSIIPPVLDLDEKVREQFAVVLFLISVVLTFLLGHYFLSINNDYEKVIVLQKNALASKNAEITDSIHYAKRIQEAKLQPRELLTTLLPDSFILYKPRDIVSGDFYYFREVNGKVIVAAADCTGHGVPGALMSMIASEQLHEAVSRHADPGRILLETSNGIKTSLRQNERADATRDGMDIALCIIDRKARRLVYSGANRPLWIIRRGAAEVEEIKGTKSALGGLTGQDQVFAQHEISVTEGDTLFMFTDGYADTFSGSGNKKLTTKRFRELLLNNRGASMQQQCNMLDTFITNWKMNAEQTDDILVIGIRL